jgi:hypothetical protein
MTDENVPPTDFGIRPEFFEENKRLKPVKPRKKFRLSSINSGLIP